MGTCTPESTHLPGAGERHSTRDKGHEEGGSAYALTPVLAHSFLDGFTIRPEDAPNTLPLNLLTLYSPLTFSSTLPHHILALSSS